MAEMRKYTPEVVSLATRIHALTVGELLALREALRADFDPPPDIGVREPRNPAGGSGAARAVVERPPGE